MDRSLGLAVLAALVAALVAAAPLAAAASAVSGTVYIMGPSHAKASIYYTAVDKLNVSIDANGTYVINVTVPDWTPDAIIVNIETNASAKLTALDANGTQLASADVVPLGNGYFVTLPGATRKVQIQNLGSSVWEGTITVLVESTVEFEFTFPQQITVANGTGRDTVKVEQVAGPPGQIYIVEIDPNFDVYFEDPTPEYTGDHMVETTGAGWSADIPLVVTAGNVKPGTYSITLNVYFRSNGGAQATVAEVTMNVELNGGVTGGTAANLARHVNAKWLGLGILVLLFLFLAGGRRGRRGMATPGGVLLVLLLIAALAIAAGLIDINVHPSIDAKMLGLGIVALLLFLMLAKPSVVRRAARRIGL